MKKDRSEYFREYYRRNKERLTKYHKEWIDNNKEHVRNRSKKYRETEKHKLLINKYKKNGNSKLWQSNYRKNNKEVKMDSRVKWANRRNQWWKEYKSKLKCSSCGENDSACLEFHHLDPNTKEKGGVGVLSKQRGSDSILKEVSKCIVLCANCHKKEHRRLRELKREAS